MTSPARLLGDPPVELRVRFLDSLLGLLQRVDPLGSTCTSGTKKDTSLNFSEGPYRALKIAGPVCT